MERGGCGYTSATLIFEIPLKQGLHCFGSFTFGILSSHCESQKVTWQFMPGVSPSTSAEQEDFCPGKLNIIEAGRSGVFGAQSFPGLALSPAPPRRAHR